MKDLTQTILRGAPRRHLSQILDLCMILAVKQTEKGDLAGLRTTKAIIEAVESALYAIEAACRQPEEGRTHLYENH